MEINQILEQLDQLFSMGKPEEVESFLTGKIAQAQQEEDYASMISLLNEMLGFCRESCQYEKAFAYAKEALLLIQQLQLEGTDAHATTLLNIANAQRAAGHLEDAQSTYQMVEQLYAQLHEPNDFAWAGLWNNRSLLYQEMGDFEQAIACLKQALVIVKQYPEASWEQAVTDTNLANSMIAFSKEQAQDEALLKQANKYADEAVDLFEKMQVKDTHYAAAMMAQGQLAEQSGEEEKAARCYEQGMNAIAQTLGKTDFYDRLAAYLAEVRKRLQQKNIAYESVLDEHLISASGNAFVSGRMLCRQYYEEAGKPMLQEKYSKYMDKMTIGLVGEGSDCFGFDDIWSQDHDWGPGFCIWLSDTVYEKIGANLQKDYENLTAVYSGKKRQNTPEGKKRLGVHKVSAFYEHFVGKQAWTEWKNTGAITSQTFLQIPEYTLAAAVNGEIFMSGNEEFETFRRYLKQGYPQVVRIRKMAQAFALFSQNAQYNYGRMKKRGDRVAATFALADGMKQALKIGYLLNEQYAPHDKWLFQGAKAWKQAEQLYEYVQKVIEQPEESIIEQLAEYLLEQLLSQGVLSRIQYGKNASEQVVADTYLEHYVTDLVRRLEYETMEHNIIVEAIVEMEWEAFDKVINEGGRAGCQDDWETFHIMRRSQYITWTKPMLVQYAMDFTGAIASGWNPIMEKYGRMEESTAPDKWNEIKAQFPEISPEKKAIMEEIIKIQVGWMEVFAAQYPGMAQNARRIHTSEDMPWDTSYETYLRGEIGTYSDTMLKLYGQFIVSYARQGKNLAFAIMEETVKMYGYTNLEEAAKKQS